MKFLPIETVKLLKFVSIAFVALVLFAAAFSLLAWQRLNSPLKNDNTVTYEVQAGASMTTIGRDLAARDVLRDPALFRWWGRLIGEAARIQAGEYEIPPGLTPRQLLDKMVRGEVKQYRLTLVEGWTFRQALQAISRSPGISRTLAGLEPDAIAARLGMSWPNPEGLLFPDTYNYTRGTTDEAILSRAYDRLTTILAAEWEGRRVSLPFSTDYEALILASIVEKETGLASERAQIAGVFVRRLEQGMRLQSDPTVIYGLGARFDGNISRASLDEVTPYNTYRMAGLPPTPIALSGRDAIRAVLNPDSSTNLYFVSRGDGSHQFSATLEEHNAAVRRYQLGIVPAQESQ